MNKITDRKKVNALVLLCAMAYFISYFSRVNLSAALVEVINSGFAGKKTAALALTVCSITYGAGQIISGFLGDRFKPQNLILTGFAITTVANGCVGLMTNDVLLVPLWGINGFAQALMWPPLVVIMAKRLSKEDYQTACIRVSWGSSFGTIAVYLLAPIIINILNIRWVFFISAVAAAVMLVAWKLIFDKYYADVSAAVEKAKASEEKRSGKLGASVIAMLAAVIFCIVLQGFLRDGGTNWMPSYVSDVFHVDSSAAILSGVILPVFAILSLQVASFVNKKLLKNELTCAAAFFFVGCLAAMLLWLCNGQNLMVSLIAMALLVASMHGVNLALISFIPQYFEQFGNVSFVSGLLNSGTYIGSAVSGYGLAAFTEAFGWQNTIALWGAVAVAGTALCFALNKRWQRFKTEGK